MKQNQRKKYKTNKKTRRIWAICLGLIVAVGLCLGAYWLFFKPVKLQLPQDSFTATAGQELVIVPHYTGSEELVYKSDDQDIFTVDNSGRITVVGPGSAKLHVTDEKHGKSAVATINCIVLCTDIELGENLSLNVGASGKIVAVLTPKQVSDPALTYTSDNPAVATVDEMGTVLGVTQGVANITVTNAASGINSTIKVVVKKVSGDGTQVTQPTYIQGILIANKSFALPANYAPGVQQEATDGFETMRKAAQAEGISLWIRSGYRSYDYQKQLYNNYVARDGKAAADTYSARPGNSEHQTGLAFDLNSLETSFGETAEGKWLAANAHKYGFIIRYPKGKQNITGYIYEPWHVRYLGVDVATKVYNSGLCLEEYLGIDSKYSE